MKHLRFLLALILAAALLSSAALAEGERSYTFEEIPWGVNLRETIDRLMEKGTLPYLQWYAASEEERQQELDRLRTEKPEFGFVLHYWSPSFGIGDVYVTRQDPEIYVHGGEFSAYLAVIYPEKIYKNYGDYSPDVLAMSFLCKGDEEWLVAIRLSFPSDGDEGERYDAICDALSQEYGLTATELDELRGQRYIISNGTALHLNDEATKLTLGLLDLEPLTGVDIFEMK